MIVDHWFIRNETNINDFKPFVFFWYLFILRINVFFEFSKRMLLLNLSCLTGCTSWCRFVRKNIFPSFQLIFMHQYLVHQFMLEIQNLGSNYFDSLSIELSTMSGSLNVIFNMHFLLIFNLFFYSNFNCFFLNLIKPQFWF